MVRLFIIIIIIICKKLTFKSNNQECLPNLNNTIFTRNSADFIYDLTWPSAISRTPYFRTKFGVLKTRHMGEDLRYIKWKEINKQFVFSTFLGWFLICSDFYLTCWYMFFLYKCKSRNKSPSVYHALSFKT